MATITAPPAPPLAVEPSYPTRRLIGGLVGRSLLWFMAASIVISLLPLLFGWGSYVIVTGSMEPGINAGDVVLVSPGYDETNVVGRVITFDDPARDDNILTHRVVTINEDGSLVTKGDANPTEDSVAVPPDAVVGMGRLLVQFIGFPVVWFHTGNWIALLLFLGVAAASIAAAVADHEPDEAPRRWSRKWPWALVMSVALALPAIGVGTADAISTAVFSATTRNTADSWAVPNWSYTNAVNDLGPYLYWKLDETGTATTAADSSGNGRTGSYAPNGGTSNFTRLADGALLTDTPDRAVRLVSANACIHTASTTSINAPQVFTVIAWFRAAASYTAGGKLLGFERPQTGMAAPSTGAYDRHLYMDGSGRVRFGVYNNAHVTLESATGLNDGNWHMAVGTQSSSGMRLYIDGAQVASNTNTTAETQVGWWRAGCGNLAGWGDEWDGTNNPGTDSATPQNRPFQADLDELVVYNSALSAQDVAFLYWTR